ncbi:MAG: tryptophan-rich sensory protein [Lachnospiraceae bacterium]|nr:tryptophan-rich sensory protein [Lachnospiraceae bacterium]
MDDKKINKKLLAICIAIPLVVGVISALLTKDSMMIFQTVNKPPLSPPGWLFPLVWTILYILMGVASYLVLTSEGIMEEKSQAISVYFYQLLVNFLWSTWFFNLQWYVFAFFWLILLWVLIFVTLVRFYRISKSAGYLLVPYLLWVTFAGYLNLGIALLN